MVVSFTYYFLSSVKSRSYGFVFFYFNLKLLLRALITELLEAAAAAMTVWEVAAVGAKRKKSSSV